MYEEIAIEPEDAPAGGPGFRWGPAATVLWTLALGAVTLVLMLAATFAVSLMALVARGETQNLVDGGGADAIVDLILRETGNHIGALTVLQTLVIIAGVFLLTRRSGETSRARMLALDGIETGPLLAWTAGALALLAGFSMVAERLLGIDESEALEWLKALQPVWVAFVLLVILAPLSEELLFRGFLFGGLQASSLGPLGAIVATSAVWSVIHLQYDWKVVGLIFIYGLVFGIVRWKSGSLWPSIFAHGGVNLLAGISAYSQGLL